MGTTYQGRTRASQHLYRIVIPILVALSLLASQLVPLVGLVPAAHADHGSALENTEDFEIDGDTKTTTSGIDWDTAKGVNFLFDEPDTAEDVWFKSGNKEEDQPNWEFVRGDVTPAKSDLIRTFATGGFSADDPHLYFGFEILDPGQNPAFHGNMEFNQSEQMAAYPIAGGGTISLPLRTPGDLNVAVNYAPSGPTIRLYEWSGSGWSGPLNAEADADSNTAGPITETNHIGGGTIGINRFVETAVNLAEVFGDTGCKSFAQAYAKTRASNPFDANLVDVIEPLDIDIDFCGAVKLRKVDALAGDDGPNGLAGAKLALYESNEAGELGDKVTECTTDADGYCADPNGDLIDLEPGWYKAVELAPPPGYKLSEPSSDHHFELARFETDKEVTFSNPPINYLIDVDPPGDNAVGNPHDFTVELLTDYVFTYEGNDAGAIAESDDTPDIAVPGATVDLSWNGIGEVKVGTADTDTDTEWDALNAVADPSSFTCTTDVDGLCYVRVFSDTPDHGTLTATYDLSDIYQHTTGSAASDPADFTDDEPVDSITDSADKTWYGFRVELDPPTANNPLDVDHDFTATVYRVFPGEEGLEEELAGNVDVALLWEEPDGTDESGILDGEDPAGVSDTGSCTTEADENEDDFGTCTVTVRSPDGPGTGTLSVTELDGEVIEGENLTVTYYPQSTVDDETNEIDGPVVDATKTWWDFRVSIEQDAINPLDQAHVFTVTVETTDGTPSTDETNGEDYVWEPVEPGTWLELDFPGDGGVGAIVTDGDVGDECSFREEGDFGTDSNGQCRVEVNSSQLGSGTLTITGIGGTWLEGYNLDDAVKSDAFDFDTTDADATKTWVDWDVTISPAAENPVDHAHTFVIDVSVWDPDADGGDGDYVPAPEGTTLTLDIDPANLVTDNTCVYDETTDTGGTVFVDAAGDPVTEDPAASRCTVTVNSPTVAGLTIEVTGIESTTGVEYDEEGPAFVFDVEEGEEIASSKQWVDFRVLPDDDAYNLVGDDHTFTLTVQETRVPDNERDDGTGSADWTPVADGTVLQLVADDSRVTGGTCLDDEAGTDEGLCTITVDSAVPGSVTVTIDGIEVTLDGEDYDLDVEEAAQTKTWVEYRATLDGDAENLVADAHDFGVDVEYTLGELDVEAMEEAESEDPIYLWYPVADGTTLEFDVDPSSALVAAGTTCDDPGTTDGACVIRVNAAAVTSATVTVTGIDATDLVLDEEVVATFVDADFTDDAEGAFTGDDATKDWISYRVDLSDDATNLVGDPHTFLVSVTRLMPGEDGVVTSPVSGGTVSLALTDSSVGTITGISGGVVDADGRGGTCATSIAGTCTVTIDSSDVGSTTLDATYVGTAADSTGTMTVSDDATKTWVSYRIDVDDDAINALGDPHTFTFSLVEMTPDGDAGVAGADLAIELDGVGSITEVQGEAVDDDPPVTTATCTTDEDGDCEVTFDSQEPGTTLVSASYLALVAGTERLISSPDAQKDWAAIDLVKEALIEPDEDGIKSVVLDEGESEDVTYEYSITNIGPVPLDVTSLEDDVLGTITLPAGLRLEPGESATVTAVDTIVSDAASVTNVALVVGEADDGTEVTAEDAETVFVTEVLAEVLEPGISIDKSVVSGTTTDADGNEVVTLSEGESATIGYEFLVTNTGDDVLVDLSLDDDKIGDLSDALREAAIATYGVAAIPVGGSVIVAATYTTTAADFTAGSVTNMALVGAVGSDSGAPVNDEDEATVFIGEVQAEVLAQPLPRTGAEALNLFLLGLLTVALGLTALVTTQPGRRE